ncbi:adenylylsulfate kinase [Idiomarina aquatica]|uniref:Adenylyl-sulfate kinase n=1 Tax=Idiomarina aquatica TaxID=1327752 RepID=A0A4R6P1X1_9GAMM|nr:adenylyl-sulfate kinase [Idiomarina aquatica]TDP31245.1 adenylylsulfate kinase [Idiomarina aquatica]
MKSENTVWHAQSVSRQMREQQKGQRGKVLWYTGLSGSGKSTIANAVDIRLHELGKHSYLLDGDNVRHGLNGDLGFDDAARIENIRRVAEVAKLFVDAGLIVSTAFISPFCSDREYARDLIGAADFIEVFIDTPFEICEQRDPKGLYQKARSGEISNFTGISSPYEAPTTPDIHIQTNELSVEQATAEIVAQLRFEKI